MKRRGLTLIEVLLLVAVIFALLIFFSQSLRHHPNSNSRLACASNLRQIHTAMTLYSQDYDGIFPMVPLGKGHLVGEDVTVNNLKLYGKEDAWKDFPADHNPSVSQNLWLLVRGDFAQPEIFTCPSSDMAGNKCDTRDLSRSKGGVGAEYFVDFTWKNKNGIMSYSFIQPWSEFSDNHTAKDIWWAADIDPRIVLAADANNGPQPDYRKDKQPVGYPDFKQYINSRNHTGDGQNALYGDGHVTFEKSANCGPGGDNIFTARAADDTGSPNQTAGVLSVRPQDPFRPKAKKSPEWDTVLIPNREADLEKWDRKP